MARGCIRGVTAGAIRKWEAVTITEDTVSLHMTLAPSPRPGSEAHSHEEAPTLTLPTARSQSFCRDLQEQREARGRQHETGQRETQRVHPQLQWSVGTPDAGGRSQGHGLREGSRMSGSRKDGHPCRALWSVVLCSCPQRSS